MVVHDVGEIVRGQSVALQEHLVVHFPVFHGDVPERHVMESRGTLAGDFLPDDVRLPGGGSGVGFRAGEGTARVVLAVKFAAVLPGRAFLAETAVRRALVH